MDRKNFLLKSGCGIATMVAAPFVATKSFAQEPLKQRKYEIEIEIFETSDKSPCHQKGEKYKYPEEIGKMCPWLLASMNNFIVALENGGILHWKYEGTPYEKVIDPDGITTEFVRCPDPTQRIIAKITRTLV